MADPFAGRVALVTGGASGIGLALGQALAARGARVRLADRDEGRVIEAAETIAAAWPSPGGRVEGVVLDVTDAEAFAALIGDLAARWGRLDYLFNNAGVGLAGEIQDLTLADWQRTLDVNLWGVIHGVRAAYPLMLAQGSGHIVNTASGAGLLPRPGMVPYAAAKHAVVGLSTSLAAEAAAHGIRVSAVCPGYIATGIMTSTTYRNLDPQRLHARIPLQPMSAEACAAAILTGVARGRILIPVSRLTKLEWALFRFFPGLSLRLAKLRAKPFAASKTNPAT